MKSSELDEVQGGLRPEPKAQCTSSSVERPVMPHCPNLGSAMFDVLEMGQSAARMRPFSATRLRATVLAG